MRPAKALSKRGRRQSAHTTRCTRLSCSFVRLFARSCQRSCTHTPRHSNSSALRHTHPHTRTHTPAAITSVAQTKPTRSVTRFHWEYLCEYVRVCVGFASPAPRFERLRKDIEHVVSARAPALSSTSSGSARSWLPSCDSVSCVRFSGQATRSALTAAPIAAQTAPTSTTATTATTTSRSQVLTVFQLQLQ